MAVAPARIRLSETKATATMASKAWAKAGMLRMVITVFLFGFGPDHPAPHVHLDNAKICLI
jgi:hypothetical protein